VIKAEFSASLLNHSNHFKFFSMLTTVMRFNIIVEYFFRIL